MIEGLMMVIWENVDIFLLLYCWWCSWTALMCPKKMVCIIFWLLSCFVTFVECVYNEVWSCIIMVIIKVRKKTLFFCLKMMIAHLYRRKMAECIFCSVLQLLYIWSKIKTQFLLWLVVDGCCPMLPVRNGRGKKGKSIGGRNRISKLLTIKRLHIMGLLLHRLVKVLRGLKGGGGGVSMWCNFPTFLVYTVSSKLR